MIPLPYLRVNAVRRPGRCEFLRTVIIINSPLPVTNGELKNLHETYTR